ncbi:PREDICTED: uncharacterized protein LOC106728090 [Myotis brandtii]|uniref:uncharacterized protein LOC106728090 n=1 Tax=Myotis brandtii TaxID=109478 RepID=UPI0007042544|nr:PREDICTED: uncharacterized protein LOC106728090 [Myotis brandtii]
MGRALPVLGLEECKTDKRNTISLFSPRFSKPQPNSELSPNRHGTLPGTVLPSLSRDASRKLSLDRCFHSALPQLQFFLRYYESGYNVSGFPQNHTFEGREAGPAQELPHIHQPPLAQIFQLERTPSLGSCSPTACGSPHDSVSWTRRWFLGWKLLEAIYRKAPPPWKYRREGLPEPPLRAQSCSPALESGPRYSGGHPGSGWSVPTLTGKRSGCTTGSEVCQWVLQLPFINLSPRPRREDAWPLLFPEPPPHSWTTGHPGVTVRGLPSQSSRSSTWLPALSCPRASTVPLLRGQIQIHSETLEAGPPVHPSLLLRPAELLPHQGFCP